MPLQKLFISWLESRLTNVLNQAVSIINASLVSGGSINSAWYLQTPFARYMLKVNSKTAYPDMFKLEADGLITIGNTHAIAVPQVILQDDYEDQSFLLLEWIETRRTTPEASRLLGEQLAAMHRHTAKQFGFTSNNYMGSLPQSNRQHNTWTSFFIAERLQPMLKLGFEKRLLATHDVQKFEQLYHQLPNLFDEEPPALIHGDLWGGNYLIRDDSTPYLIDPAISYGHREFDLAMTTLFGGFGREFYESYQDTYPLAADWRSRVDLWNLYPLLIHLNLFGAGYLGQAKDALAGYV